MKDKIQHIYIDEGITSIGEFAFYDMPLLSKLVVPKSVNDVIIGFSIGGPAASNDMTDEEIKKQNEQYIETIKDKLSSIEEITWGDKTYASIEEFISEIY